MRRQAQPSAQKTGKQALLLSALFLLSHQFAQAHVPGSAPGTNPEPHRFGSTAARRILISIPDRKLALLQDGVVLKVYPIAVGAPATPSPTGAFKIINRITHPAWYGAEDGKPVPAGPENPLGSRWMGLSKKGYGIHGTNAPKSIGKRASHGCIRMARQDLEELFELVRVGDAVVLEGRRTAEVAAVFAPPQAPAKPVEKPAVAAAPVVVAAAMATGNF
jgi:hypothetical protein